MSQEQQAAWANGRMQDAFLAQVREREGGREEGGRVGEGGREEGGRGGANMSQEQQAAWANGRMQDKRVAFLAQVRGREGGEREGGGGGGRVLRNNRQLGLMGGCKIRGWLFLHR